MGILFTIVVLLALGLWLLGPKLLWRSIQTVRNYIHRHASDEVNVTIGELFPNTLFRFPKEKRDHFLEKNRKYAELFDRKRVRLKQEKKFIETDTFDHKRIIIEYHCVIV